MEKEEEVRRKGGENAAVAEGKPRRCLNAERPC